MTHHLSNISSKETFSRAVRYVSNLPRHRIVVDVVLLLVHMMYLAILNKAIPTIRDVIYRDFCQR